MILNVVEIKKKKIEKFLISIFKYNNIHQIPVIDSISVNTNLGTELDKNSEFRSSSINVLRDITLQKPKIIYAKKSVSNFKIKEGEKIALKCTLRKEHLALFLTKLIFLVLPQIENLNEISLLKHDKQFNVGFGIREHLVFPEIGFSFNLKPFGFNINFIFRKQKKNYSDRLLIIKLLQLPKMI